MILLDNNKEYAQSFDFLCFNFWIGEAGMLISSLFISASILLAEIMWFIFDIYAGNLLRTFYFAFDIFWDTHN